MRFLGSGGAAVVAHVNLLPLEDQPRRHAFNSIMRNARDSFTYSKITDDDLKCDRGIKICIAEGNSADLGKIRQSIEEELSEFFSSEKIMLPYRTIAVLLLMNIGDKSRGVIVISGSLNKGMMVTKKTTNRMQAKLCEIENKYGTASEGEESPERLAD